jgi:hypothetical protein
VLRIKRRDQKSAPRPVGAAHHAPVGDGDLPGLRANESGRPHRLCPRLEPGDVRSPGQVDAESTSGRCDDPPLKVGQEQGSQRAVLPQHGREIVPGRGLIERCRLRAERERGGECRALEVGGKAVYHGSQYLTDQDDVFQLGGAALVAAEQCSGDDDQLERQH